MERLIQPDEEERLYDTLKSYYSKLYPDIEIKDEELVLGPKELGDLYYTKADGQDTYTVYIASKEQNSLRGIAYFVKDGKLNPKELIIEADDSTWNNLPSGFTAFKASCDFSLDEVAVGAQLMFSIISTLSINNPSLIVDKTISGA